MSVHVLTLDSLEKLDMGKANEGFALHLKRAALDCMDRPGDDKERKVVLEIAVKPLMLPDGSCDEVKAQIQVFSKIPNHRTKVYSFGLRRNGSLVFSEDSPDNVNQTTLMDDDE